MLNSRKILSHQHCYLKQRKIPWEFHRLLLACLIHSNDFFCAASIFARPISVIRPLLINRETRFLFNSDHLLLSFLGVNFLAYRDSSIFLIILSTHQKHNASSTAHSYSIEGFPMSFFCKILARPHSLGHDFPITSISTPVNFLSIFLSSFKSFGLHNVWDHRGD